MPVLYVVECGTVARAASTVCAYTLTQLVSPAQHALILQHLSDKGFCDYQANSTTEDTQADFNAFYEAALQLLNRFIQSV